MASKAQQSTYPSVVEQYCALLAVSEAIISNRDLLELFHDLAERLSSIISFDCISVLLHDAERDVMRLHLWQTPGESVLRPGWEASVEGTAAGWVWQTQAPLVVHDIDQEKRFPLSTQVLREHGMKSYYVFPLSPAGRRLGAMGFGCKDVHGCSDESLEFMQQSERLRSTPITVAADLYMHRRYNRPHVLKTPEVLRRSLCLSTPGSRRIHLP